MAENSMKPRIRFKGYTDAWEQRKLGTLGETYAGLSGKSKEDFGHGKAEFVPYMNVFMNPIADVAMTEAIEIDDRQAKVKNGDIFFTTSSETPEEVGMSSIWLKNGSNIYLNSFCFGFRPSESINSYYLAYMLRSSGVRQKIVFLAQGISRYNISKKKMMEIEVPMPICAEQRQLGGIFKQLDNLITLHQRKYDKIVNIKKALLEKMFPADAETTPKIRFRGFTDAWEQRKVGELLIERKEQTPKSDEYPLMAFIANEGVAPKGERYDRSSLVNDAENKLYKRTEYGDFIYSSNNLETGSIGVNKYGKATISPVYSIFYTTELADSDFIGRRLIRKDFINEMVKWRQGVIYGQWRIHEDDFVKIKICVPKTCEQRKIGTILDNLDNLITLHQRQLEKLKNIKSALLEKMFV